MRIRLGLVAVLVLAFSLPASAQESGAVIAAKQHLRAQAAAAFASGDLADLHATDAYLDRRTGATMVYLSQRHAGIEVWGAIAPTAVLPSGKVQALAPRYEAGLASRVNATEPRLDGGGASTAAQAYVRALPGAAPSGPLARTDGPDENGGPALASYETTEPRLVYQPTEGGALRLAWALELTSTSGPMQMWAVRVDALTGSVLAADDLVARDVWAPAPASSGAVSLAPLAPEAAPASALGGASYRVVPWPAESPNHGDFAPVSDPADATASRNGWHSTGTQSYTTTRGNNVWAYLDRNDSESPDPNSAPEGGAGLAFDFAYDADQNPEESASAAITNLFYWGNVFHDITYRYGFDEAAGNFQTNNYGNGGRGNDVARLEAQSGAQVCNDTSAGGFACYNNANFGTPSDGASGRMQMYEWYNSNETLEVSAPAAASGDFNAAPSLFGVPGTITGTVVGVQGAGGVIGRGCTSAEISNAAALSGNIALIERGDCAFSAKVRTAQQLGAVAAIIHNNDRTASGEDGSPEDVIAMAISPEEVENIRIPALFVAQSTGLLLREQTETVTARMTKDPKRDSDFDSGVIVHEFGHGLSNRLTGGPSASACLNNQEQMGEGWSDYYGLLLTMEDASDTPRGIGTYLTFEGTDGAGIRPFRYARDLEVNPLTYQNVIDGTYVNSSGTSRTLSVPHGIGSVWASTLWDMTLDLVGEHGFDPDAYDADGGAGNQIALNLVTQGLKLQPCLPGFVDGRDAILKADTTLYGGAYSNVIWAAFARRGLGALADQGTSGSTSDGTADFSMPVVANERGPNTNGARLAVVGSNPVRRRTTVSLSLAAPEAVTVEVLDLLGRTVRTLHEGPLAAASAHAVSLDVSGLAPGIYVVRARGETFSATQRVTVVR